MCGPPSFKFIIPPPPTTFGAVASELSTDGDSAARTTLRSYVGAPLSAYPAARKVYLVREGVIGVYHFAVLLVYVPPIGG